MHFNQNTLSTFLFFIFPSGQQPYDGPLVLHCLVCIFSLMATSWGPVGVSVWWTFETPMSVQWQANIVSIPKIPLCVDLFDGGLVIFIRQHVCWLPTGGLCEGLSLQKTVCSTASTSVSYIISVQLHQMMSRYNSDVFIQSSGMAPWLAMAVCQLFGWSTTFNGLKWNLTLLIVLSLSFFASCVDVRCITSYKQTLLLKTVIYSL